MRGSGLINTFLRSIFSHAEGYSPHPHHGTTLSTTNIVDDKERRQTMKMQTCVTAFPR